MIAYVDLNITINTIAAMMTPKCGNVAHGIEDTALIHFKISMRLLICIEVKPIIYQKLQNSSEIKHDWCYGKMEETDLQTDAMETGSGIFWKIKKSYSRICLYVLPITSCFQAFVIELRLAPSCKHLDIVSGCVLGSM